MKKTVKRNLSSRMSQTMNMHSHRKTHITITTTTNRISLIMMVFCLKWALKNLKIHLNPENWNGLLSLTFSGNNIYIYMTCICMCFNLKCPVCKYPTVYHTKMTFIIAFKSGIIFSGDICGYLFVVAMTNCLLPAVEAEYVNHPHSGCLANIRISQTDRRAAAHSSMSKGTA